MLSIHDLVCARGDRQLFSGANFELAAGEGLYVSGPNGAGKTSLLRLICGLAVPEHGEVRWGGESIRQLREDYTRNLLFLGHAAALKDELSAVENLRIGASLAGREVSDGEAMKALRLFGLKGREHLPARVLSAGQRRRVNLARMLLPDPPRLWVLDEPFTALDAKAVTQLSEVISAHLQSGGMAIFTTHQEVNFSGSTIRRVVVENGGVSAC